MSTMIDDPRLIAEQPGVSGALAGFRRRVAQGEIGQLPVIIGLAVIWAIFYAAQPAFLSAGNLTNLMLQIAAVGTISVGIVLILLLGEIDLSVGAVSGLSAGVMTVLNVQAGIPAPLAILAGLGTGLLIGLFQGFWITRFRIPSFVVTLAGLLAWQGALLFVLGKTGTINIQDSLIRGLANTFFDPVIGWTLGIVFVAYVAIGNLLTRRRREAAGLATASWATLGLRIGVIAALVLLAVFILNADRGVPSAVVFLVGIIVVFDYVTKRTRFGRQIFAIGGNAEAARRAGINVSNVRVAVFALASTLAAWGGLLAASRLLAVHQSAGGGDVLLNAIASAVIGGTSLFGGRGSVWAALLGALVIGSISNGMDLLSLESSVKFMITGGVLLTAVTIDAIARRGREASGRG